MKIWHVKSCMNHVGNLGRSWPTLTWYHSGESSSDSPLSHPTFTPGFDSGGDVASHTLPSSDQECGVVKTPATSCSLSSSDVKEVPSSSLTPCDLLASSGTVDSEKIRDLTPHVIILNSASRETLTQQNKLVKARFNPLTLDMNRGCVLPEKGKPVVVSDSDDLDLPTSTHHTLVYWGIPTTHPVLC